MNAQASSTCDDRWLTPRTRICRELGFGPARVLLFLVVLSGLLTAQDKPGEPCFPAVLHVSNLIQPWDPNGGGGMSTVVPTAENTLSQLVPKPAVLDADGALVLQFPTALPLLSSVGSTALSYVNSLVHTSNDKHALFVSVPGGHPYPGGPGGGGGIFGPYLKARKCSPEPQPPNCSIPVDPPTIPATYHCVCTLVAAIVMVGQNPPVPTQVFSCDCEAEVGTASGTYSSNQFQVPNVAGDPYVGTFYTPGSPTRRLQYYDWDGTRLVERDYFDIRHSDGTVVRYRGFFTIGNRREYHVTEIVDPRDNRIALEYDASFRLERIRFPNGVLEEWNYSPSWTDSSTSGVEVTYILPGTGLDPSLTWGVMFQKTGLPNAAPFRGDRMWRIYYPKTRAIADSPGNSAPYASLDDSTPTHVVYELGYGTSGAEAGKVTSVVQYRSAAMTAAALSGGKTLLCAQWEIKVGRSRVWRLSSGLFSSESTTFDYSGDAQTGSLTLSTELDDMLGTYTTRSLDSHGRTLDLIVTPSDDLNGRPRAHDPGNAGLTHAAGEPKWKKWVYQYDACGSCARPIRVTEFSEGSSATRVTEYDYWSDSGLLKEVRLPNPSSPPGQSGQVAFTFTYTQGPIAQGGWSAWYPASESGPDGTWTFSVAQGDWVPRAAPTGPDYALGYGYKPRKIVRTSPTITLADNTQTTVSAVVEFDVSNPPTGQPQTQLVGQVKGLVDLDGVTTGFEYDSQGFLQTLIRNAGGASSEQVTTTIQVDTWGRIVQMVQNAGTSLAATYGFTSTITGHPVAVSTTVGSVTLEEKLLLDRWGNVAVRLRTNKTSTGTAPDDFGPSPRTEQARTWLQDEYHWQGQRLQYSLEDRRELDRAGDGSADYPGAHFLLTTFLWDPQDRLVWVGRPNGGSTVLTYDGYGTLYKTLDQGSGQSDVLREKLFVDAFLQVVDIFRGDAQKQLWTRLVRNGAGAVTQVTEPVAPSPGSWYAGSLGGAVREFDRDAMGRVVEARSRDGSSLLVKTVVTYDQVGRPRVTGEHILGAGSGVRTVATLWDGMSRRKKVTDDLGRFVERTFDALSRVRVQKNHASPADEVHVTYLANTDLVGKVERKVVEQDLATPTHVVYRTEYEYDKLGRTTHVREFGTGSTALVHAFSYYAMGFTETYTDPSGKLHRYLPDARGRLAEHFLPGTQAIWNGTVYLDHLGSTTGRSQLVQVDGRNRITRTNYDFAGRVLSILEPGASAEPTPQNPHRPFARLLAYDAASRLTDVYAADAVHVRYFHDGPGRLIGRETPSAGINGYVSWYHGRDVYQRDAIGRIVGSNSYYGPAATTMPLIVEETFLRDSLGRKHRESFRYGFGGSNWIDLVSTFTGTDWFRSGLSYQNNLGSGVDDLLMSYTPDAVGRLSELKWQTSAGGSMSLLAQYWHQGSAISRRDTYHAAGSAWKTDYAYDTYGRMSRIEHRFGTQAPFSEFDFQYDLASNLEKEWYSKQGGGVGDRFAYDEHHRLLKGWLGADATKMQAGDPEAQGSGTFVTKLTYGLDAANNRGSVQTEWGAGGSSTETYTTQDQGHPQGESNRYATVAGVAMDYDQRGNTIFDGNFWYVYDDQNRLTEVYLVQDSEAALASPGLSTTTWSRGARYAVQDRAGVVAARRSILGRLPGGPADAIRRHGIPEVRRSLQEPLPRTSVSRLQASSTQSLTGGDATLQLVALYLYDGFDRRVARAVIGVQTWFYSYDDWEEAQEMVLATQTVPDRQFVWGEQLDELVAYRRKVSGSWQSQFVAEGGAHCPARVLGADGLVKEVQEYDPYGQTTLYPSGGGSNLVSFYGNPFHWKGHRFDPETGLVYMRHRYYHAGWGRFLTQDPLGVWFDGLQLGNGYAYGASNPTSMGDPLGLQVAIGGSNVIGFLPAPGGVSVSFGDGTALWFGDDILDLMGALEGMNQNAGAPSPSTNDVGFLKDLLSAMQQALAEEVERQELAARQAEAFDHICGSLVFWKLIFDPMLGPGYGGRTRTMSTTMSAERAEAMTARALEILAAKGGARAADPNKLHHIFGRGGHGLDDVVKAAGSREAALGAIEKAAQGAFDAGRLTQVRPGVFEGAVNVGGLNVNVRGAPVDGSFRIGSAWR